MFPGNNIERRRTGEFRKALIGNKKNQIGEVVKWWGWGGVDLQFEDDAFGGEVIITYANSDVEVASSPEVKTND